MSKNNTNEIIPESTSQQPDINDNAKYKLMLISAGQNNEELAIVLNKLLGYDERKINTLIAGVPSKITRNIDYCRACTLRDEIEKCGAKVQIVEMEKAEPKKCETTAEGNDGCFAEIKKGLKPVVIAVKILVGVMVLYLLFSGKGALIITDFLASDFGSIFNDGQNPYIEMVSSMKPFNNISYIEAFNQEFDKNEWSYFKSDGKRIVQVKSYYNGIDDEMITQFLLTPQGDEQFLIEPYAISVSGTCLTEFERNMVIAALFKGDLSQKLLNSMLQGAFSN